MKRFHVHLHVDDLDQGIAWEHFHTLDHIPVFREQASAAAACCTPSPRGKPVGVAVRARSSCG